LYSLPQSSPPLPSPPPPSVIGVSFPQPNTAPSLLTASDRFAGSPSALAICAFARTALRVCVLSLRSLCPAHRLSPSLARLHVFAAPQRTRSGRSIAVRVACAFVRQYSAFLSPLRVVPPLSLHFVSSFVAFLSTLPASLLSSPPLRSGAFSFAERSRCRCCCSCLRSLHSLLFGSMMRGPLTTTNKGTENAFVSTRVPAAVQTRCSGTAETARFIQRPISIAVALAINQSISSSTIQFSSVQFSRSASDQRVICRMRTCASMPYARDRSRPRT
jgi:hypothetical protein